MSQAYGDELKVVPPPESPQQASPSDTILAKDIQKHITFLASDTLEGREAGTQGGYAAGAYIAAFLKKLDQLKPAGNNDCFQYFDQNYRNILFEIPGTDPELSDEIILIGGHYDHVGYGNRFNSRGPIGQIHNGADDNASGIALLLDLAEAFQSGKYTGKRTILFAFWDGEEKGLLGSKYWVEHPTRSLSQVKMVYNVDMVGRMKNRPVTIIGTRSAYGLRKFMSLKTGSLPVKLQFDWLMDPNSDHYPFFLKKMPVAFFHTGKHTDYHRPSDDVDKIDFEGIEKQGHYLYKLLLATADDKKLPIFRPESVQESLRKNEPVISVSPEGPSRLGISWAYEESLKNRVILSRVIAGSPAADAGLQVGDEIISFGGYSVNDCEDFRQIVRTVPNEITAEIKKKDSEENSTVSITLLGEPQWVGISWFTDTAEPESIILTQVLEGSTADLAGLTAGDRIYQINDMNVNEIPKLDEYLLNLEGTVPVQFEHSGHVKQTTFQFLPVLEKDEALSQ